MKKSLFFTAVMLFLSVGLMSAQNLTVTGKVTDLSTGNPISFAAIQLEGTLTGGSTDGDGVYSISVPADGVLVFSSLGYKTLSVEIDGKTTINVGMTPDAQYLDETIVVAYGTAKKSSFTGSAATVGEEKLAERVVSNVSNALAGQVAGVQSVSSNGAPGASSTIMVRGIGSMSASSTPLYVVDGVPFSGAINTINPADIESMTVLKDAAANAIYGARGANGVILITTKRGKTSDARITVDAKWGTNKRMVPNYDVISSPAEYYELHYRALYNSRAHAGYNATQAHEYASANLIDVSNGGLGYQVYTVPVGQTLVGTNFKLNPNATLGYNDGEFYYTPDDWYQEVFGHGNLRQEYNATVSGTINRMSYYASFGYLDDTGLVKNSSFSRYSATAKADYQAKRWIKIGTNIRYTQATSHQNGSTSWGSSANLFYMTNMIAPIYPMYVRDAQGNIKVEPATGTNIYDDGATETNFKRPFMGNARPGAGIDNDRYNNVNATLTAQGFVDITPFKGFKLSANVAVLEENQRANALYSRYGSGMGADDGSVAVEHNRYHTVNQQYLVSYKNTFGRHTIDLLAGYEQYKVVSQNVGGSDNHLYNPFLGEINNAGQTTSRSVYSSTGRYMTQGFLGRVQYDFAEKYFLSASYRRDASSRFHKDSRWGDFGSVGGAWLISEEGFMADAAGWMDMLKVKASWGVQGNDSIGNDYAYADQYSISYSEETGEFSKVLSYKGNKDITWETSYAFNTGFDFELFRGRFGGTFEYFLRDTKDLLYNQPVPMSSGISTGYIPTNVGKIRNAGVELELFGTLVRTRNVQWTVNANLTHYKNTILDLAEDIKEEGLKGSSSIYKIGGSLYQSYLKQYAGVDKATGLALYYVDPDNGDYSVTTDYEAAQRGDCGSTLAKIYGGFGTSFNAYGFDLSMQFAYQVGGRMYDGTYQALMHTGVSSMAGGNWHKDIRNAWTPENTNTNVPRLNSSDDSYQKDSDRFLVSSNYLSLNNVTIGYTFPAKWMNKIKVASLRVYVTGDNLAVFTARKGLDPRARLGTGGSTSSGNYGYSAMRNISGGITINF